MSIDEMIEALTAFKEGKEIEFRRNTNNDWVELKAPAWNFNTFEYRIKPQPEYIPFTWEDRDLFRDKWIRLKTADNEHRINFIGSSGYASCANWADPKSLDSLFESHVFIDGSVFGKLKIKHHSES